MAHITKSLEKEIQKALAARKAGANDNQRQLEQERKKLQNLIAAIEGGASSLDAAESVADRETTDRAPGSGARKEEEKPSGKLPDLPSWVGEQLKDLAGLLKSDPAKVKSEFRRLNLQLTFHPTEAEPRDHYIVKGQCDLGALVFSICVRGARVGSGLIEGESGTGKELVVAPADSRAQSPAQWHKS